MTFLDVENLKVYFPIRGGILNRVVDTVKAVDGVSFSLKPGETYGLVGESGSGKTTTGRAIIGLNHITSGTVTYEGRKLNLRRRKENLMNRKDIQMIFQDPYSSLNPRKRIIDIISEPLKNYDNLSKDALRKRVQELMEIVGLPKDSIYKYPHEFSGGQRQRIGIARAVALRPKLIIADEPVSALDVSVQAQVLNFMQEIQKEFNLTYLFISHDLGVIKHMCDRIGIIYKGRYVEEGTAEDIFDNPQHIYTKRLVAAIPDINPKNRESKRALRKEINQMYSDDLNKYFDEDGLAYDLQPISDTHSVALPKRG